MLKQETKEAIADAIAEALSFVVNENEFNGANYWRPVWHVERIGLEVMRVHMHIEFGLIVTGRDATGWIPLETE